MAANASELPPVRGWRTTLRVAAVHCWLLARCQSLDGFESAPVVPAERKACREYENRVSALILTEP
ncbi:hypothetical protein QFZ63_000126 [Streptomyces sp. B3I7]|uniref:hypothetical protein n=1 Tax=Streptomyces sp. B3I7 TaxID=3042269 RepID=UPI00277D7005|nr:hypothetical protein [Streptomyces sp. B3I7]MDQ0808412.1 hypothetical protein [Streptomyces sp. B3I7]